MLLSVVFLVLLFLLVSGVSLFLVDGFLGGLDFATGRKAVDKIARIVRERHLENSNFYDLGSARGGFAVKMNKSLPNMKITGIDDSIFRIFCAKFRTIFLKNLNFKKGNIFNADISSADVIYLYLPQELMPDLEKKLQKELKSGALVISASVSFPSWQPAQVYDLDQKGLKVPKLFIYAKN